MRKLLLFILILSFGSVQAQEEFSPGSPYSAFGIGDLRHSSSLRTDAMGILGISLGGNYVNNLNNAVNTDLELTTVTLGFRYVLLKSSTENSSSDISNGNITGINLGIPVWRKNGMVLNFGFNPYSVINYKITGTVSESGTPVKKTFAGNGGLSRLNFGASGRLFNFLNIGAEYNFAFGNVRYLTYFDFSNQNMFNTYIKSEDNIKGHFVKGGLMVNLKEVFPKSDFAFNLNLGFMFQSPMKLSSNMDRIYGSSVGFDTVNVTTSDVEVPQAFGFGISKQFGRQLIVSGDILFQQWSSFKPGILNPGVYDNNFRLGAGVEILPAVKTDRSFWEGLTYRLGMTYEKSYFLVNSENVNSYVFNFGCGIPLNAENSVDLAFQLGQRGKTDTGFIKDQFIRLAVGLNFGELWFIRTREED